MVPSVGSNSGQEMEARDDPAKATRRTWVSRQTDIQAATVAEFEEKAAARIERQQRA
jgi:hypothetical protein